MAFVPAPNIVSCEIRSLLNGEHVENRIYVNCLHEPIFADLVAITNALATPLASDWVPLLPTTLVMTELFVRSLHEENGIQATVPLPAGSYTGTNSSPQLPNNCTLCVSLRSSFAGRSARGRLYWQALCENQVVANQVDPTPLLAITEAVTAIDVALTAASYEWTIVSYINNGAPRPGGPVYFLVNSILVVDPIVDSMRRRLPGRGI